MLQQRMSQDLLFHLVSPLPRHQPTRQCVCEKGRGSNLDVGAVEHVAAQVKPVSTSTPLVRKMASVMPHMVDALDAIYSAQTP